MKNGRLLLFLFLMLAAMVAYAQSETSITLPAGLQPITTSNAAQVGEVALLEDASAHISTLTFAGDMADNTTWLRAAVALANAIGDGAVGPNNVPLVMGGGTMVRVFDDLTSTQATPLEATFDEVGAVALSPDGATLAVGSVGAVSLWDVATLQKRADLPEAPYRVNALAFSPDGTLLASASGNVDGTAEDNAVHLWNVETGEKVAALLGHESAIWALAFSPDGSTLASAGASSDWQIFVWEVASGQRRTEIEYDIQLAYVTALAFSADGSVLAASSANGFILLWDAASGTQLASLELPEDERYTPFLSISPDGRLIASGNFDKPLRLWGTTAEGGELAAPEAATDSAPAETEAAEAEPVTAETETSETAVTCVITAPANVNLRGGPGTNFERVGGLAAGQTAEASGQTEGADGFTWYQLTTGEWAREDVISAEADCANVPAVTP